MNILLIILIFVFLAASAALSLSLYMYFGDDKKIVLIDKYGSNSLSSTHEEGMKLSTSPKYTLKKSNLNKSHVVMGGHHKIVIPSSSKSWNGVITISNLQDVTDTIEIKTKARIRIIEYNENASLYGANLDIDGKVWNYDKVKGTIDANNYTATIYFTGGLINIDIHTVIMPSDPVLS